MKETELTFEEFKIHPLNEKKIQAKLISLIEELKACNDAKSAVKVINKMNKYTDDISTDFGLIEVHFQLDTTDPKYKKLEDQVNQIAPALNAVSTQFMEILVHAPYIDDLKKIYGEYAVKQWELALKTFSPDVIEEATKENELVSQYSALIASAQIEFNGEVLNLPQMNKYTNSADRETRRAASLATAKFFEDHDAEFGDIYDQLVHVRDRMAKKLGYKNYVELGYDRMGRMDYDPEKVKGYRDQIYEAVVPYTQKLYKSQIKRIGVKNPQYYDYNLDFLDGNPTPKMGTQEQVQIACNMYDKLSPEIGDFFHYMVNHHLLDLDAKPGKMSGGFCTSFPRYKAPFVFANNNGTLNDVETLTHEIGHAFQFYCARKIKVPEYREATMETCEIHSMSMEFLTWPYMEDFFKEDTTKYKYSHLKGAITFLPYGVTVDEFQHWVYENVDATHEQRCAKFRELEHKYQPHLDFSEAPELEKGGWWLRQAHIFQSPFYYIDYTLAQVVAFEFLDLSQKNPEKAINKYIKLCKYGGRSPFVETLKKNHLRNPFEEGNVAKAIRPLKKILGDLESKL
ncbi:MAG: M3 family oligoendopeptidase [Coprobacillus sp.]|nr:M3 family oligoendopeptidase [Coprobacillus sp.]